MTMKSFVIVRALFLVFPLLLAACGPAADDSTGLKATNLDVLSRSLGSGFDSLKNRKLAPCIDSSSFVYSGSHFSDLSFLNDASYEELLDEHSVGLYGKASLFGLVSAKISGDIITTLASTDQSGAFIYKFEVTGKSAVVPVPRLNEHGMSVYNKNDPIQFRENCGDQFVEQVKLGAKLYIGLKYTFTSKEAKEKLLIKLRGSLLWGLIKFSKTWSKEHQDLLKNVRVSVEAFQIGGDPRKLEEIKASIHQGSCAGEDAEKCSQSLDRLIEYAQTDFANQLDGMAMPTEDNKGPVILGVSTKSYAEQKIYDKDQRELLSIEVDQGTKPGAAAADALSRLREMEVRLKMEGTRIKALKDFQLSPEERASVDVAGHDIDSVLAAAASVSEECNKALNDSEREGECVSRAGLLQGKADAALKPVSLPSRIN